MYVKESTGQILGFAEICAAFPKTSFPESGPDDDWLKEHGHARLAGKEEPALGFGQAAVETMTARKGKDKKWYQVMEVVTQGTHEEAPPADYADQRREKYPPSGDQLDAIWKVVEQLRDNGTNLPAEADAMLDEVLSVKEQFPKPE